MTECDLCKKKINDNEGFYEIGIYTLKKRNKKENPYPNSNPYTLVLTLDACSNKHLLELLRQNEEKIKKNWETYHDMNITIPITDNLTFESLLKMFQRR